MSNESQAGKSHSLSFNTRDDAFNFARKLAEDSNRWLSAHNISRANDYFKAKAEVQLHISSRTDSRKFKLVSSVVPGINVDLTGSLDKISIGAFQNGSSIIEGDAENPLMFIRARKFTERPKEIVPSIVRIELQDEIEQIGPYFLTVPLRYGIEIGRIFAEWEIGIGDVRGAQGDCAIAYCLVKGVSQIIDNGGSQNSDLAGDAFVKPDLDDSFGCLRIELFKQRALCKSRRTICKTLPP